MLMKPTDLSSFFMHRPDPGVLYVDETTRDQDFIGPDKMGTGARLVRDEDGTQKSELEADEIQVELRKREGFPFVPYE